MFDRDGAFVGLNLNSFGQNFLMFSRQERGAPVVLVNVEESSVFLLAGEVLPVSRARPAERGWAAVALARGLRAGAGGSRRGALPEAREPVRARHQRGARGQPRRAGRTAAARHPRGARRASAAAVQARRGRGGLRRTRRRDAPAGRRDRRHRRCATASGWTSRSPWATSRRSSGKPTGAISSDSG